MFTYGAVCLHVEQCIHLWSSVLICGTVCSLMEQSAYLWSIIHTCEAICSCVEQCAHLWSCSPVVVAYLEHVDEPQVVVGHSILFVQFEHRLKVRNRVFVSKQSKHRYTD